MFEQTDIQRTRASAKLFHRYPKKVDERRWKARQYINENTGQVISRRDYQTLANGGIKPEEKAVLRKRNKVIPHTKSLKRFNELARSYKQKTAVRLGKTEAQVKIRGNSAEAINFREQAARLRKFGDRESRLKIKPENRTKKEIEELIDILTKLGFRDPSWTMPPGQSPKEDDVV